MSSRRCERVLVTGGQGFTGRHLLAHWLRADPDVHVVAVGRSPRSTTTFTAPLAGVGPATRGSVGWGSGSFAAPLPDDLRVDGDDRYTYRALDLTDAAAVADVLSTEQVDTVVHLAASLRDSPFDALVRNNVVATRCLLEAVGAAGCPIRVVLASSGSLYGAVPPGSLPVTEDTPVQPIDEYSVTKRTAEDLASVRRRAAGLDVVVGRIFNVIGRGEDERHLAPHLARQFAQVAAGISEHVEVGPLATTRDFVDVEDVAAALVALATEASSGDVVNVASGRETPTREVFDVLAAEVGYESGPVVTRPARPLDMPRQHVDVSRLVALGHTPSVPLADSLRSMLAYYLDVVRPAAGRPADVRR